MRSIVALIVFACALGGALHGAEAQDADAALRQQVNQLRDQRKYGEALVVQRTRVANTEKAETDTTGNPGKRTADALGSLAWEAIFAGSFDEAIKAAERAHALAPDLLWIETNRAHALLFVGRVAEARKVYAAHKGARMKLGSDKTWDDVIVEDFDAFTEAGRIHPAFAEIVAGLGIRNPELTKQIAALRKQITQLNASGKYAEAMSLAERHVDLARERYGENRSEFATALNWQASLYKTQGLLAEAAPLFERAVAIIENTLGFDHLDVASGLTNLASVHEAQGRLAEAEPLYKRSLNIREKALGTDHLLVAASLNNLAAVYKARGRFVDAEPLLKRTLAIREKALGTDHPLVASSLNDLASLYQTQGRYTEAAPLFNRSLAIIEKARGGDHPDVSAALNNLAVLYSHQARYADAIELYKRSIAIREKAHGAEHSALAQPLSNLAQVHRLLGEFGESELLYKRGLALREKALGPNHADVGQSLDGLAQLYKDLDRHAEAELLAKRALAITERARSPNDPYVGTILIGLASLYRSQGRNAEAEPLYRRALSIYETKLGPDHRFVGTALNGMAALHAAQGRQTEAEPLFVRALAIAENAVGLDHPEVAEVLDNLAGLYKDRGRYVEAEPFYRRALAIREKAFGLDHREVGKSLNNLALLYVAQGRYDEAEGPHKRGLALSEKALGPDHTDIATSLNNLASLYREQRRYTEAEPLYKRSLAIREKALGADHPSVGHSLNNLAVLYNSQGRYADAEPLYARAVALFERAWGSDHPSVGIALNNLAALSFAQSDWARSLDYWRRSTSILRRRAQRGAADVGQAVIAGGKGETVLFSYQFESLVKAAYRVASDRRGEAASLLREMFQTAQWAQGSEAAASLAQMAARGARGDAALASLVRERQDLVADWQYRDIVRSAAVGQSAEKRDRAAETANVARLAAIDARIADIDKLLTTEFPDYTALAQPLPLSIEEVQAQLAGDEALVLFLVTPESRPTAEETFIWVVTRTDVRLARSDVGSRALTREVSALRCGLDAAAWQNEGAEKCAGLLQLDGRTGNAPLPFDTVRAHRLYKTLFGAIEDQIRDKHLLIIPSGPLTQLPFHVLVTESSSGDNYKLAAWFARKNAITVLPATSSLKALRRVAEASRATKPMIGFGNPLLDGDPVARPWEAEWAKLARQKQACPQTPWQRMAAVFQRQRGVAPLTTQSGRVDLDHLRLQAPLHDTADELCAVAKSLNLGADDIVLGARATETTIKRLSDEGRLADYRVLHFATHGTLAGQIDGTKEPGLILTPPKEQSVVDDGYLSASEVAALKVDADWVILSACNTAAGGAEGAEALSGMARAFFYAGARALLVSHWSVDSAATVKLITTTVGNITRDKRTGRAEALRRAMLAMIDTGEPQQAHPSYWAPFVVVGEGAAAR